VTGLDQGFVQLTIMGVRAATPEDEGEMPFLEEMASLGEDFNGKEMPSLQAGAG
jgi:hypothetical protein